MDRSHPLRLLARLGAGLVVLLACVLAVLWIEPRRTRVSGAGSEGSRREPRDPTEEGNIAGRIVLHDAPWPSEEVYVVASFGAGVEDRSARVELDRSFALDVPVCSPDTRIDPAPWPRPGSRRRRASRPSSSCAFERRILDVADAASNALELELDYDTLQRMASSEELWR